MFEGFTESTVDLDDSTSFVRYGGSGPAVVLLHGHPRTSSTWYAVAPQLVASGFTVVCPDLRGYGRSRGPDPDGPANAGHVAYGKRAVAGDVAAVMARLGHETYAVVGHDRGAAVAFRLAMDRPEAVDRLALLDGIPLIEHLERTDQRFATAWWHWFFFAQPDIPERVITADPDAWYAGTPQAMGAENHAEFRAATRDPLVVRGMLEDYRAGLGIDAELERADRATGRRLRCPVAVNWSSRDDLEDLHGDPREILRAWAADVTGHPIDSGHHQAEENPDALVTALRGFLGGGDSANR